MQANESAIGRQVPLWEMKSLTKSDWVPQIQPEAEDSKSEWGKPWNSPAKKRRSRTEFVSVRLPESIFGTAAPGLEGGDREEARDRENELDEKDGELLASGDLAARQEEGDRLAAKSANLKDSSQERQAIAQARQCGSASECSRLAREARTEGEHQQAIDYYTQALAYEERSTFYNNRGVARSEIGDDRGALDDYLAALGISQRSIHYANAAGAAWSLGRNNDALEYFQLAFEIDDGWGREPEQYRAEALRDFAAFRQFMESSQVEPVPLGADNDLRSLAFYNFFASQGFFGQPNLEILEYLFKDSYQEKLVNGTYFSCNADFNPEFRTSLANEQEKRMREVAKIITSILG